MDDQIDIRFIALEARLDTMEKFNKLDEDSLGDHTTWIIDLKQEIEKQQIYNANIVKRIEELEDKMAVAYTRIKGTEDFVANTTVEANIRFDQGIENRTKAFDKIDQIEEDLDIIDIKLERIDDILVVHRNQSDTQRKNHANLIKVWDEKVIPLIEGTHGKEVPRKTDAEQAIIDLNKTLFGKETNGKQK